MDIKALVEKVVNKIKADPSIAEKFTSDPKAAVVSIIGSGFSGDVITKVINGVKEKLAGDGGNLLSKIGGLFG